MIMTISIQETVNCKFTLRPAVVEDVDVVCKLLREIRLFHRCDPNVIDREKIQKYGFGPIPRFKVELATVADKIVGFAMFYIGWAGFEGDLELRLEDIYVQEGFRGQGIGTALFRQIAAYALANECTRIEFEVTKDNDKALQFYSNLGAERKDMLCIVRMNKAAMQAILKE